VKRSGISSLQLAASDNFTYAIEQRVAGLKAGSRAMSRGGTRRTRLSPTSMRDFRSDYLGVPLLMSRNSEWRETLSQVYRERTLDHVVPLSKGGKDEIDNVLLVCRSCNARKGARPQHEYVVR
jgi:hypothetical protein